MKILAFSLLTLMLSCASNNQSDSIKTTSMKQTVGDKEFGANVFYPATEGKKPALIVVHEWWGHNEYAQSRARQLAMLGYVAMSIDMFGDDKQANHPSKAGEFAGEAMKNSKRSEQRFLQAIEYLESRPDVDASRIGAIGYCFGGSVALHMARIGADLKAVAAFHSGLKPVVDSDRPIKTKIAVYNGADDPMITQADIQAFENEMKRKKAEYFLINYPGAKHAFTNPEATKLGKKFDMPLEYQAEADHKSWHSLINFLHQSL